jgi:hypothetical protein
VYGITYKEILSNKRAFMATLINMLAIIAIMYVDPILAVQLTSLGMSEANAGFAFAAIGASFGLGGPVVGYLCNFIKKTVLIQIGAVLVAFAVLLVGPSQLLGFQPYIWLIFLGVSLDAFFAAFLYIPVCPEIIEAVKDQIKNQITSTGRLNG